jgi:phenylpropionate dioxygenase-like ring-hydroxylating dioxygenase large terminal subunit
MLSKEDNELLTRIGPGTPMGAFMRQYWIPAARSDELEGPNSIPLRIKLLGEELIGFRTSSGKVGLIENSCPHRGASLYFGRNEEEGLRCIYHGWKFDHSGACLDMPSEPPESTFKERVRAVTYPCLERNGIIWTYMGPRQTPPPLPDIEANLLNTDVTNITILHRPCNWMQGWEGEMDTVHASFLHYGAIMPEDVEYGSSMYYMVKNRDARFDVRETPWGTSYGAYRPAEPDSYYWRIAHMLFPFYAMIPSGRIGSDAKIGIYVPMDDEHTLHWEIFTSRTAGGGRPPTLPTNRADWFGRFNTEQNAANDYLIDRDAQRKWESYTGIEGVRQQDMAVTESMGPIYDRSREHLGTTDQLIILTRRKLLATARALRDHGTVPPGVDDPSLYRQRSGDVVLPRHLDWWQATQQAREHFEAEVPVAGGGS